MVKRRFVTWICEVSGFGVTLTHQLVKLFVSLKPLNSERLKPCVDYSRALSFSGTRGFRERFDG